MQVPVEIAFRHCEPSRGIRSEVARQVRHLEKFSPRVTSCRVVVTGPQTRRRRGGLFEVELRIAMPEHNDIVVEREMRDQVKEHVETDRGRVTKFLAGEDYGFIESADGREIYFHRNAVIDGAFDRLKVGSEVAFVDEAGEKGAQASTVRLIGKHRPT